MWRQNLNKLIQCREDRVMKNLIASIMITLALGSMSACTTGEKQATGIAGGAVLGGVAGNALTGGSAVGTVAGAVGGGLLGNYVATHN
jgi:osmotically inducible lipoprotein OsmB